MKRVWIVWFASVVLSCTVSPLGRQQLKLYPDAQLAQAGLTSFEKMKRELPQAADIRINTYVRCVARAIVAELPTTDAAGWEVVVFEDKSANAFALPGKRIGVDTGLLTVATSQDQLATVVGHEVAHVLAGHANERVSQESLAQAGLGLASRAAGSSPAQRQLVGLLGAGAQIGVLLPFSRSHESEADLIGLDLMARAGFDPRESVTLWRNMGKQGGAAPPEFLSTHPSGTTRIRDLEARLPSAMRLYETARTAGKKPACTR